MAKIVNPSLENIALLCHELAGGQLVAIPTETVYGLAADARNTEAIQKIYQAKNRPALNPLIAHYATLQDLEKDVVVTDTARKLAQAFWPGPLTLVLAQKPESRVSQLAPAGLQTLAVRIPSHPVAQQLLRQCGFPLVAPSANPSGTLSPVSAAHVQKGLGNRIAWILDGGESQAGLESTIVDVSDDNPVILRPA